MPTKYITPEILTHDQLQIIIGSLLGDGHIELASTYPRLKIERSANDKEYLQWEYSYFKDFCRSDIHEYDRFDKRYNKWHSYNYFRTVSFAALMPYYQDWYIDGVRQVPENVELTPLTTAVWFCDDGCVINENNSLIVKLSTESFGEKGVQILVAKLEEKFDLKFPIFRKKKNKDQFFIKATGEAALKYLKYISNIVAENGMSRKYNIWKNYNLDYIPHYGSQGEHIEKLFTYALEQKDILYLTAHKIMPEYKNLRDAINDCYKAGYFTRYESADKYNLYHYALTPAGEQYFTERLNNKRFL